MKGTVFDQEVLAPLLGRLHVFYSLYSFLHQDTTEHQPVLEMFFSVLHVMAKFISAVKPNSYLCVLPRLFFYVYC